MNIPEQAVDALENELECHEIWSTHDYFECECGHRLTAVYELAWPAFRKHRATAARPAPNEEIACETCSHPGAITPYPCPTIQALDGDT